MVNRSDIMPWRCGRCGDEMDLLVSGCGDVCPRCEHVLCRSCRVRVRIDEGTAIYCRQCAGELGLPEEPERRRSLFGRRRRE